MSTDNAKDDLKPFDYELHPTPKAVVDIWVVRLQAVAIVTALLAQIEVSLLGSLPDRTDNPPASDTALRVFGYSGLILNLGATLSAVLMLLAVTSVPTAARRLYMTCKHSYPHKVYKQPELEEEKSTTPDLFPRPQFQPKPVAPDTHADMKALNRFLLTGNTEGNILYAFGVARGWGVMLRHCILCFVAGCVCTFVHVGIALWVNESTLVAAIMMPVAFVSFVPPLAVFVGGMETHSCAECEAER
ncbi:hypothetical protein K474DRAFT_1687031 [Panus rudis PR-1116 ss-1]|nr:hypothetical protein K474DRAFT_1687031 [Panus rudis PR-1116 ss-1]